MKKPVSNLISRIEGYNDEGFEVLSIVLNGNNTYTVIVKEIVKEEKSE